MGMQQQAQAQAETEAQGKETEHARNIEKEKMGQDNRLEVEALKAAAKQEESPSGRSVLSAVPIQWHAVQVESTSRVYVYSPSWDSEKVGKENGRYG